MFANDDHIFGSDSGEIIRLCDNDFEPSKNLLATPERTPTNLRESNLVELAKEIARLKALNEEARKEALDRQKVLQDKVRHHVSSPGIL